MYFVNLGVSKPELGNTGICCGHIALGLLGVRTMLKVPCVHQGCP